MALFYECMLKCARKLLDTADIVRDAIYREVSSPHSGPMYSSCQHCFYFIQPEVQTNPNARFYRLIVRQEWPEAPLLHGLHSGIN